MQEEEKIYVWKALGVKCLSSQIARSFLEGRIGQDDLFLQEEEAFTISDLFARDAIIREIIGPKMESLENSSTGEGPVDTLARRLELFKRIMLRGDDSSALFLSELDAKEKRIGQLQAELRTINEQLSRWQRDNGMLVQACRNAGQAVESFAVMLEAQKRNLTPDSELSTQYREMVSIAEGVARELQICLRKNLNTATNSDFSPGEKAIEYTNTLDLFRVKTENELNRYMKEQDAAILSARSAFEEEKKRILDKLNADREEFERYKERENRALEERRNQFQQTAGQRWEELEEERKQLKQRIAQSREAAESSCRTAQSDLFQLQFAAGKFERQILEEARRIFQPFAHKSRFYFFPWVPMRVLSIPLGITSWRDIAPQSILAFYDCSWGRNASSGILVTTRYVCLYDGQHPLRYPLLQKQEFRMTPISSAAPYCWAGIAGFSGLLALAVTPVAWIGTAALIPAVLSSPWKVEIQCEERARMVFRVRSPETLRHFCMAVDELCRVVKEFRKKIAEQ